MTKIQTKKQELKKIAIEIRRLKSTRKSVEFGYVEGLFSAQCEYRLNHIAYCIARGRTLEEIEGRSFDDLDDTCYQSLVTSIVEGLVDEAICISA